MPIHPVSGSQILYPDGPRTIRDGGVPAVFLPGWTPVLAWSGLHPVTVVCFRHEGGDTGLWFLDAAGERRGGRIEELPGEVLAVVMEALCPLLDGMLAALLRGEGREPTPAERAFVELPPFCREALVSLHLGAFRRRVAVRPFDRPGSGAPDTPVFDLGSRRIPLRLQGMHVLFDPGGLQRALPALLRDGFMLLPSPVDGALLHCDRSLVLDADLVAYRLRDPRWNLTAWLVAGGIVFRTVALFVPDAGLVLIAADDPDPPRWDDLASRFDRHVLAHGEALFNYLAPGGPAGGGPAGGGARPVHAWRGRDAMHPGHVLWNDLSGLARLVVDEGLRPDCLLPDSAWQPEMWGRLDVVFPELRHRIRRRTESLAVLADELYRDGAVIGRASGMRVDAALRRRLPRGTPPRNERRPILLLGLRTENGTLDDLPGFCRALVAHLAAGTGPVVLAVDGHDADGGAGTARNPEGTGCDELPAVAAQRALVRLMRDEAVGTAVEVVSLVGATLADSLAWCDAAGMFVSFWGTELAKYRWACNRPGLVLTSAWNLAHLPDLGIYADPAVIEDPTELELVPAALVRDLPDAPPPGRRTGSGHSSTRDFAVDVPGVLRRLDAMAARWLRPVEVPAPARPRRPAGMKRPGATG
ncbi:MAG: hypothetical protein INR65_08290 [Gluconacetobacter diazotrophicus]|nr:hypothetical protein [Gluconacetobacter diazotrophicus]